MDEKEKLREFAWRRGLEDGLFDRPSVLPDGLSDEAYLRGHQAANRAKRILAARNTNFGPATVV
jgi:hypothetical protein